MEPESNLDVFPSEIITQFLIRLSPKDLANYCQTSQAAKVYCQSDAFWKDKYRYDFGPSIPILEEGKKWIDVYKRMASMIPNSPLSVGENHYAVIDDQGILYMAGENEDYQLGDGTTNNSKIPIPLKSFIKKVIGVSCGKDFTIAITEDGKVYGWGSMETSDYEQMEVPTLIEGLESYIAVKVSCGGDGWGVVFEDGSVYYSVWREGVLKLETKGIIPTEDKIVDISVDGYKFAVVTKSGDLYFFSEDPDSDLKWPEEFPLELKHIPLPEKTKQVSLSRTHVVVLSKSGNVYTWGKNKNGQLGLSEDLSLKIYMKPQRLTSLPKISYISSSKGVSVAITTGGKLYVWGENKITDIMVGVGQKDTRFRMSQYWTTIAIVPVEISIGFILDQEFPPFDKNHPYDEIFRVNYVAVGKHFSLFSTIDGMVNYTMGLRDYKFN